MRHNNTKQMLTYWMELFHKLDGNKDAEGNFAWPERSDVQPASCRNLLGDMFILDIDSTGSSYRLAGTRLCAMQGREMKYEGFSDAFRDNDRRAAASWVSNLGTDDYLVLICSDAHSRLGEVLPLETLLLPLAHHGASNRRALGITSPLTRPKWVGSVPIVEQQIRSVRIVRPWEDNAFTTNRPITMGNRRRPAIGAQEATLEPSFAELSPDQMAQSAAQKAPYLRLLQGGKK